MTNDDTTSTPATDADANTPAAEEDGPSSIGLDLTMIPADGSEGRMQTVIYGGGRRAVTIQARATDDNTLGIEVVSSMGDAGTELLDLLQFLEWLHGLLERQAVADTLETAREDEGGYATASDTPATPKADEAAKTGYESSTSVLGAGPGRGNALTDEAGER